MPPTKPKPSPEPLCDVPIALEVVQRTDRIVPAWAFRTRAKGLMAVLNTSNPLVERCLIGDDAETLAFLIALPLAEILIVSRHEPWCVAALERIKADLMEPDARQVRGCMFLGTTLAGSEPFRQVAKALCSNTASPEKNRLITVVKIGEQDRALCPS